jgi:hypothetical protein
MMEKLAQAGEGGERADIQNTPPISTLSLYVTTDRSKRRELTIVMAGKALMVAAKKRKVNSPPTKVECSFALTFPGAEQERR